MNLPDFLTPQISISLPSATPASGSAGGSGAGARSLQFTIQLQEQDFWCWAAVSASISAYYDSQTCRTQCLVANVALSRHDCCNSGAADLKKCNQRWYLDGALRITRNLRQAIVNGPLSFSAVQSEIGAGAPAGCRVGWYGGTEGHFMVITGWVVADSGVQYIEISDPIYLNSQIEFGAFASSYMGGGDWTHSYLTAGATLGGAAASLATMPDPASIGA
jgi:Papain-like cysteine protease AvrRpt2